MRVLILNQFFYPDHSATAQLMADLAEDLSHRGVQVSTVAGRDRYTGGEPLALFECWQGIEIHRVRSTRFERASMARRATAYVSFFVAAFIKVLALPRQDTILVLTTPPLISVVACMAKLLRNSRVVYVVQDLYPDVAIELGAIPRSGIAARVLHAISRWTMRYADAVVALGECMRRRIEAAGVPASKVHVLQNWADGDQIRPIGRDRNRFRREQGLDGKFVVLYSGNFGKAHDLQTILEAALQLRNEQDIVFVFIGEGTKLVEVREFIAEHKLSNIRLLPYQDRGALSESLSAGDVCLISLAAGLGGLVVPSKLYGIMAAGRPAILVGAADTEVGKTLQDLGCGYVVQNGDADRLCEHIRSLRIDRALADEMGRKARIEFERRFDRKVMTRRHYELLSSLPTSAK